MEKEKFVELAQQGDREALAGLWERTEKLLYLKARSFFLHMGAESCARHGVTLDDLRQECYFAFLDALRAYKPEGEYQFTTYLNHASRNRFRGCMGLKSTRRNPLDYADSLNASAGADEDNDELGELIEDPAAAAELGALEVRDDAAFLRDLLKQALKELSPMQEIILRKRFVEGLTRPDVAQLLHITLADVRREENRAVLAIYHGQPGKLLREEWLEGEAYHGTGFSAWKRENGSVEERIVENMPKA